tara:strand:- start:100 stop:1104 length:1005 start_codon:yes stop_codon:yes gene_type:complete
MKQVKWGIIGAGRIANDFAKAFKDVKNGILVGIASKNPTRLKNFSEKYKINKEHRFDSYKKILSSKDIDAVYIALTNNLHSKWVIESAKYKKHVLVEKPAFLNHKEALFAFKNVKKNKIFFMEALMYVCHPQILYLIKILKQKKIGKIISIKSSFGIKKSNTKKNSRLYEKKMGGGSILDIGIYCVSISRLIASAASNNKEIKLKEIKGNVLFEKPGVDNLAHGNLKFSNNISAKITSCIHRKMKNNLEITGNNGKIILDTPWKPTVRTKVKIKLNSGKYIIKSFLNTKNLYSYEINLATDTILKKNREAKSIGVTWKDTTNNLKILDAWKKIR